MAGRPNAIPPVKCTAHGRKTKKPCGKYAVPGAVVCELHGGKAPRVKEKALTRLHLAELMRSDPRPVWEVVLDHVHSLDAVAREARLALREGESVMPDQLDRIVESAKAALTAAKLAIDTRSYEMLAQQHDRQLELDGQLVADALAVVLDALVDGLRLPVTRVKPLRSWAFEAAAAALSSLDGSDPAATVPVPPPPVHDLTIATVEPASSSTARTSSTSDYASDVERQRTGATSPSASRSSVLTGVPAATVAGESDEPLDAELVDEPNTSPATAPTPQPGTSWQPSNLPNPWRYGGHPATRAIG